MIIDTSLIEEYLDKKSAQGFKNHWIFNSIESGKYLFEEPDIREYDKINKTFKMLSESLIKFKPDNIDLWKEFFGSIHIPDDIKVYIIVGSPEPYDAMCLKDDEGNYCVVLDLVRIGSYSNNTDKILNVISSLITHEAAHFVLLKTYKEPSSKASLYDKLAFLVFNEGIAHILGYCEGVLEVDWYSKEMKERREKAYSTLLSKLNNPDNEDEAQILEKADSGRYFDKFGSIAGLFAIVDYYNSHNKDISCFGDIFRGGPKLLMQVIENNGKI